MATLKEIKKRVGSAKTVYKITRAMKLVSASKARAAQIANGISKPYSDRIYSLVRDLWTITDPKTHPLLKPNSSNKHCYLIITSDKGLCGSLIDDMEDFLLKEKVFDTKDSQFIMIGKRGVEMIMKRGAVPSAVFELGLKKPSFEFVSPVIKFITRGYLYSNFGDVTIYYTAFVNSFKQVPEKRTILPALIPSENLKMTDIAIYEPNADKVLESLIPRYLEIQLYQLLLESVASEHSARMMAMDKATNNAQEIIDELTLVYNKVRQEKITRELLEITTTISALKS